VARGSFRLSIGVATVLGCGLMAGSSDAANISPPTISGIPQVGQTLTEGHGTWSPPPSRFAYQWEDCDAAGQSCRSITGAWNQTYQVAASDLGHTLRVQETAFAGRGGGRAVSAPTAVVSPAPNSTATSLMSLETSAFAEQPVTLIATVTSSATTTPPAGTLSFENGSAPISGCQDEPISASGQSVTVTCQTSFTASVVQLSAVFTPTPGSGVAGSVSVPETMTVEPEPTQTSVTVSSHAVRLHRRATYTAAVRAGSAGALEPSGVVGFFDQGRPIPACASQPLTWTGASELATCTVRYRRTGQHRITARYLGDANFAGSTSSPAMLVDGIAGSLHPILSWTFYYAPRYTTVLGLTVADVPPGAEVRVTCIGRGCPLRSHSITVPRSARAAQTVELTPLFGGHRLKPGTVIALSVVRSGWIGRRYSFEIRPSHPPRLAITCRAPGLTRGFACQT
jgi:Bacterial Ig-like domain (group 3)